MNIKTNDIVQCNDQNVYRIVGRKGRMFAGHMPDSASQRLFKSNGQYAGGDRMKNVAKVIG